MAIAIAIVGVVLFLGFVWWLAARDGRSTRGVDPIADDMRRADDGRSENPFSDYGNPMGPTGSR